MSGVLDDVNPKSKIQNLKSPARSLQCARAQASLEMTAAMIGALLLFFAGAKVWLWVSQRLVTRQQGYETSRVAAGDQPSPWVDPAKTIRLKIFE